MAGADARQVPVALSSFSGKHMHLFLRKHADRLDEDVLTEANATSADATSAGAAAGKPGGLWSKVGSWTSGGKNAAAAAGSGDADANETVHVFTVASGHM